MAAAAVRLLQPGQFVFLDAGTTNLEIARALPDMPLTVATSHVDLGVWMRSRGVLLIPEESWSPAVLRRAWRHALLVSKGKQG